MSWEPEVTTNTAYTELEPVFTWNFLLQESGGKVLQEDSYKLRVDKTYAALETWAQGSTNSTVWT